MNRPDWSTWHDGTTWLALLVACGMAVAAGLQTWRLSEETAVRGEHDQHLADAIAGRDEFWRQLKECRADNEHDRRLWLDCEAEVADCDSGPRSWRRLE
jgi:hypothetical protein